MIKKQTDRLIERTKTKPQEALELKLNKQMDTFSFNPPINLAEEGKCLLAVISFDATKSVFNITKENNTFSVSIPGFWVAKGSEEIVDKLTNMLQFRSENDIELHIEEIEKKEVVWWKV